MPGWTTPRTWTDGELVTKAIMDPHIRDNFNAMGPHLIVRKTSDESDSTGVVQNDDSLLMALAINETWQFRLNLLVVSAASTDFKCRFTFPSGNLSAIGWGAVTGTISGDHLSSTTSPGPTANFATADTVTNYIILEGVMSNAGSAGNLQLQWSGQAAATCTMKANSTLWGVKLA